MVARPIVARPIVARPIVARPIAARSIAALLLALLVAPVMAGCPAPPTPVVAGEIPGPLKVVAVEDAAFATAVHRLLREGAMTPERAGLLAGAVRRQLDHAKGHFDAGKTVRGTDAVVGALYLLRIGELHRDMLGNDGAQPLQGSIEHFSARGDEGRVLALMTLRKSVLAANSPELAQQRKRRATVEKWVNATRTGGDMTRLAADRRRTVGRAMLEPSDAALQEAATAVNAWIERAIRYNLDYQKTQKLPPRTELSEAFRALEGGAATMASLFLRHGRVKDAVAIIESSAARRIAQPLLFRQLRAVAEEDDAESWRELARTYAAAQTRRGGREDLSGLQNVDESLLDAATWGVALEAYRRDPSSLAVGHILADRLVALEMAEVAPLVLGDALGTEPTAAALGAALITVRDALTLEVGARPQTARRIYANSAALLALADGAAYRQHLSPATAAIRQSMAGIELRHGNLSRAKQLLNESLQRAPSVWGYTMLAALERQAGNRALALSHATRAAGLPAAAAVALDAVDAKLLTFELLRDGGDATKASAVLGDALALVLNSRKGLSDSRAQVRAERQLARILDSYGKQQDASRAIARAIDIAQNRRDILGVTVLGAVGRALVQRNLQAARVAVQTGIQTNVDDDDLVYGALWLMFLEKQLGQSPDGKVDRILRGAVNGDAWTSALARWATGMNDNAALRKKASNYAERVEADFYIAMRAHAAGDASAQEKLRKVASAPMIDLMEVQIARDMLAPAYEGTLPAKVRLP